MGSEILPHYAAWVAAGRPAEPEALVRLLACYDPPELQRIRERERFRATRSGVVTDTPCSAVCTRAAHDICHCSCGGANHGSAHDQEVLAAMEADA